MVEIGPQLAQFRFCSFRIHSCGLGKLEGMLEESLHVFCWSPSCVSVYKSHYGSFVRMKQGKYSYSQLLSYFHFPRDIGGQIQGLFNWFCHVRYLVNFALCQSEFFVLNKHALCICTMKSLVDVNMYIEAMSPLMFIEHEICLV